MEHILEEAILRIFWKGFQVIRGLSVLVMSATDGDYSVNFPYLFFHGTKGLYEGSSDGL